MDCLRKECQTYSGKGTAGGNWAKPGTCMKDQQEVKYSRGSAAVTWPTSDSDDNHLSLEYGKQES